MDFLLGCVVGVVMAIGTLMFVIRLAVRTDERLGEEAIAARMAVGLDKPEWTSDTRARNIQESSVSRVIKEPADQPLHREFCPRCAIKHLAQARALFKETKKGYPQHVWYAIGHMAEAEDEIIDRMPEEANAIRASRLELEKRIAEFPVDPPDFKGLMELVAKGALLPEVQVQGEETHE